MAHQKNIRTYSGGYSCSVEDGAALLCISKKRGVSASKIVGGLVHDFVEQHSGEVDHNCVDDVSDTILFRNIKIRKRYDDLTVKGVYRKASAKSRLNKGKSGNRNRNRGNR